jgi:hypothetical protein
MSVATLLKGDSIMRPVLALLIVVGIVCPSFQAAASTPRLVRSAQSGPWSAPTTWEGGKVPSAGVQVLVKKGHTVSYDVQAKELIRSLHISGMLTFEPDRDTLLEVGLIKIQHGDIVDESGFDCAAHMDETAVRTKGSDAGLEAYCLCCEGKPSLLVGTPERPIEADRKAVIRLHYIDGMDKESCPAIVCCGGRMDFHGASMSRTWVRLGRNASRGDAGIVLSEPVTGWKTGDRLIVTTTSRHYAKNAATEEVIIQSIDGANVALEQPLSHPHSAEDGYYAEVANLSRNVVVESANPDGLRGHTMYHRKSSGSISFAEFRHLGKKGVLGRYSLHYHLCGDTMRGSSVVGASIWDSHNRWITVHGTQYLVVRDCVGYKSVGHGFFLEDGTEVYNVFDRNLACQAMKGLPLPKQMLPYDKNDGAGFWWANSHNRFTRNVAVDCERYGFRFDAEPKAGAVVDKVAYGSPKQAFDLTLPVRQPDGSVKPQDIRTLPFVRFEDNETHSNGFWGLNLGQHSGGKVGPRAATPFVIRNMKIWDVIGGFGVEVPHVLIDGMVVSKAIYATRESLYVAQDYRNVTLYAQKTPLATLEQYLALKSSNGTARARQPGWPKGNGDGGPKLQSPEIEVARLNPIDKLPPITVITGFRKAGSKLMVQGVTSDNGAIARVMVNGKEARMLPGAYGMWEIALEIVTAGQVQLTAHGEDRAGNVEQTAHRVTVVIR